MIDYNLLGAIIVGCISFVIIRVGLYVFTNESNKPNKNKTEGINQQ